MTDQQIFNLDLFPTVEVRGPNGGIAVPAEIVAPGIAITPFLDLGEGRYKLGGGYRLTHIRTGYAFVEGQACIECARSVGKHLAALSVDWDRVDLADDVLPIAMQAFRQFGNCQQQICQIDDDGEMQTCEACGFTGCHAPFCISMVVPMVSGGGCPTAPVPGGAA